uniref:HAT C-terminal dimerisation domain-containing protein n=1 Tax=Salarias fasciatus TaxID=181472 RepID=A0A672FW69_SALFA
MGWAASAIYWATKDFQFFTCGSRGPRDCNATPHHLVAVRCHSVVEHAPISSNRRSQRKVLTEDTEKFLKRKNEDQSDAPASSRAKFVREYNPDFIKPGFVNGGSEAEPRAQCVECGVMLANEALKPSKLRRHLETKHPTLVGKPVDFFKRKESGLHMQKRSTVSLTGDSKCALKASYLVARRVAQSKKAFTIAEDLILPAALDESTDVTNAALLLVFVRYRWDSSLHEDILFCGGLPTRATAEECLRCMDRYFTENGRDWQNCVGVCSDGAASMTGRHHGVIKQILDRAPEAKWTHCFLHRESLAAKKISPEFHEVMDVSVKTINFIKSNAANSRCFAELCEGMEADHVQLLYHSEVRWRLFLFFLRKNLLLHTTTPTPSSQLNFLLCGRRGPRKREWTCFHLLAVLSQLSEEFAGYFPEDPREGHMWVVDPFSVDLTENDVTLPSHLESQLLDVSTDTTLKREWGKLNLGSFWIVVSKQYPCLAQKALKLLLPFTTTYLCESGFSIVATTKTKSRNRLRASLEATLRVSLSPIPPRLDLIRSERQAQASH